MPEHALLWEGEEWEEQCMTLVRIRCMRTGAVFQRVPAEDSGDCGIEAFCSDGTAYQCYAPNGPLKISDRYDAQRDKLTADLSKLVTNEARLRGILGQTKIKNYVFLVPRHDSRRLNAHAKQKAEELRTRRLSIIDDEFDIWVHTEADYPLECQTALDTRLSRLQLGPLEVGDARLAAVVAGDPELVARVDSKVAKIITLPAGSRPAFRNHIIKHLERGADAETAVRELYPAGWELLIETRAAKEVALETESMITPLSPHEFLLATVQELRSIYSEELSFLRPADVEVLAWGTVADWLATCPLDFVLAGVA